MLEPKPERCPKECAPTGNWIFGRSLHLAVYALALSGTVLGCTRAEVNPKTPPPANPSAPDAMPPSSWQPSRSSHGALRDTPGELTVLDWAGFKGAVSYTFDDANSSQIEHFPELRALGVRMTFYLITSKPEARDATWQQALRDGHEIGNHTHTHQIQGTLEDIDAAQDFLERTLGVRPTTMAAPYGAAMYSALAPHRFFINRGVRNGLIAPNDASDPFNLNCYVPEPNAVAAALNEQVDAARAAGKWRIILVHGFAGGTDQAYQPIELREFVSSVEHAKGLGDVWIDTVENIGAYWLGQRAFSRASRELHGGTTTWRWQLP
ncbi:MAG TPA: polysaccharide deacetylase family protein, partial [Polyangiaceae bacterium]|nr:polysaccharide deacetylase family protein [Polyangiaceae bacterium]